MALRSPFGSPTSSEWSIHGRAGRKPCSKRSSGASMRSVSAALAKRLMRSKASMTVRDTIVNRQSRAIEAEAGIRPSSAPRAA